MSKLVPRRSDKQCRERFCNVLDPGLKREDEWAPEEDAALRAAIAQHTQPDGKVRCVRLYVNAKPVRLDSMRGDWAA